MECAIEFTTHANLRLIERGVSIGEVRRAVSKGAKSRRGQVFLARLAQLVVVFRQVPCHRRIITAYWED